MKLLQIIKSPAKGTPNYSSSTSYYIERSRQGTSELLLKHLLLH